MPHHCDKCKQIATTNCLRLGHVFQCLCGQAFSAYHKECPHCANALQKRRQRKEKEAREKAQKEDKKSRRVLAWG